MVSGQINTADPQLLYASGAIIEPVVPFTHEIPPLEHGYFFIISGFTPPSAKQFAINLNFNRRPQHSVTDVALHIKPQFKTSHIVRNTHVGGAWGEEEVNGEFPLAAGSPFECFILVQKERFKIAFNREHFATFYHRMPHDSINELKIDGDVKIFSVYIKPGPSDKPVPRLPAMPAIQKIPSPKSQESESLVMLPGGFHLHVPYSVQIPGGLHVGRVIFMTAVPNMTAQRFKLELSFDPAPESDIALHFDTRFAEQKMVRNSRTKGKWGKEELESVLFPFKRGKHFDLCIWVMEKCFLISVGCQHVTSYKHRFTDLGRINTLQLSGDITLSHVRMR